MPLSAWIMFLFGAIVLWGGLIYFASIAFKSRQEKGK